MACINVFLHSVIRHDNCRVFGNFENYLSIYIDANIHVLGMNVDLKYSQT